MNIENLVLYLRAGIELDVNIYEIDETKRKEILLIQTKYADLFQITLHETKSSIETELDQIFKILSIDDIVKAIEFTFYKPLKDKFKQLTTGHFIWVNQHSFDLAISKLSKLPFEKKSNVRFCQEKNELSVLMEEVVELFTPLEILDLLDETMIQSNIRHSSPTERTSMWPAVITKKFVDLSEANSRLDIKEDEILTTEISNDDELNHMLESFTSLGFFRPGFVTRRLGETFKIYGVNLSVNSSLSHHDLDSVYDYINDPDISTAESLRRNNLVYNFLKSKRVVLEEKPSRNTFIDKALGDIQMLLDQSEFNYYMSLFEEGFKCNITESVTINTLVQNTIGVLYDDYHVSCQNGFFICRCVNEEEFHEYTFLLSADATGTFIDTMKNVSVSDAYCLIPFCLVTKDDQTMMYKRGYIHNQNNLYGHAVQHAEKCDTKQTIPD